jgi:maltose alpha-D-glucosyltransferase/alpha-amylase
MQQHPSLKWMHARKHNTNGENLPETDGYLKELRAHVEKKLKDWMLLSEANQRPEDAVAYSGKGDMYYMTFYFPLVPRIFIGLQMEDCFLIVAILEQTPSIAEVCQWELFL